MDNKTRVNGGTGLSESAQDYLEAIIEMESLDVPVRVAALARRLGTSRPTGAMGAGSDRG
jgi:Mn-dependent DtxR family transcriptional regulator